MYGTTPALLVGQRRRKREILPRFAAAYAMHRNGMGKSEIGRWMGGRDHSTIGHAIDQAEVLARYEPGYADVLAEVCEAVPG
jgi:chromosomal replication initiation ATPase DnaA